MASKLQAKMEMFLRARSTRLVKYMRKRTKLKNRKGVYPKMIELQPLRKKAEEEINDLTKDPLNTLNELLHNLDYISEKLYKFTLFTSLIQKRTGSSMYDLLKELKEIYIILKKHEDELRTKQITIDFSKIYNIINKLSDVHSDLMNKIRQQKKIAWDFKHQRERARDRNWNSEYHLFHNGIRLPVKKLFRVLKEEHAEEKSLDKYPHTIKAIINDIKKHESKDTTKLQERINNFAEELEKENKILKLITDETSLIFTSSIKAYFQLLDEFDDLKDLLYDELGDDYDGIDNLKKKYKKLVDEFEDHEQMELRIEQVLKKSVKKDDMGNIGHKMQNLGKDFKGK